MHSRGGGKDKINHIMRPTIAILLGYVSERQTVLEITKNLTFQGCHGELNLER